MVSEAESIMAASVWQKAMVILPPDCYQSRLCRLCIDCVGANVKSPTTRAEWWCLIQLRDIGKLEQHSKDRNDCLCCSIQTLPPCYSVSKVLFFCNKLRNQQQSLNKHIHSVLLQCSQAYRQCLHHIGKAHIHLSSFPELIWAEDSVFTKLPECLLTLLLAHF